MAYNAYTPYYTPYYQPQYVQPVQQSMPAVQSANQPSIIWVRSQNEAAMYPVAPNNAVAMWDSTSPSIYLKQADASGKPTMKIYDLVERTDATPASADNSAYATKEELATVVGAVKSFNSVIDSIKMDISKMNDDLYGIAGKKKAAKKLEEVDD